MFHILFQSIFKAGSYLNCNEVDFCKQYVTTSSNLDYPCFFKHTYTINCRLSLIVIVHGNTYKPTHTRVKICDNSSFIVNFVLTSTRSFCFDEIGNFFDELGYELTPCICFNNKHHQHNLIDDILCNYLRRSFGRRMQEKNFL